MAIQGSTLATTFGARSRSAAKPAAQDLPKAQIWLNIGYLVPATDTREERFVSLPVGIPLDTMEKVSTRSSNTDFALFQQARNDLFDQIMEQANRLAPGEYYVMECQNGLAIQIRRVNAETEVAAPAEGNPYGLQLFNAA